MDSHIDNQIEDEIYYEKKYLKYKLKYLALKEELNDIEGGLTMKSITKAKEAAKEAVMAKASSIKEQGTAIAKDKANAAAKKIQETAANAANKVKTVFKKIDVVNDLTRALYNTPKNSDLINKPEKKSMFSVGFDQKIVDLIDVELKKGYDISSYTKLKVVLDNALEEALKNKYINSRSKLKEYLLNAVDKYYK